MRRLTRVRRGDQGAVATIVAMLFMFGVMLGLGALTVDVGNINANRRQLQNGADAVALAAAKHCADVGTCAPNDPGLQILENANANPSAAPGVTGIRRVDGQTPAVCGYGPGLTGCPSSASPSTQKLQECPAAILPPNTNYVRVYTETTNAAGTHLLPYSFGAAIAGVGSGANQQTCASVAWGPIGTYTATVPLTISLCMFDQMVAQYGSAGNLPAEPSGAWPGYGPGHVNAWPPSSAELIEYTTKYAGTCLNSNGHTANGSFGWMANSLCNASVTSGSWINGNPGNNEQCAMSAYYGKRILVPIFDCIVDSGSAPTAAPTTPCSIPKGGGANIWYHISGWASFYLSGYRFPGDDQTSVLSGLHVCGAPDSCLAGWLTKLTLSGAPMGSGSSNYGVKVLQNVG
jgi:Flp pilus assembly protein TadG